MPKLGLGLSLPQTKVSGGFTPKKLSGLSLWLKADAGITKETYNFASRITLSGNFFPSGLNGIYTANSNPIFNYANDNPDDYTLNSHTTGNTISWESGNNRFTVYVANSDTGILLVSSNGINWSVDSGGGLRSNDTIFVSGITGAYSFCNGAYDGGFSAGYGTYSGNGNQFISGAPGNWVLGIYDYVDIIVATNSNQYPNGTWTNVSGSGTITSTVPIEGTGTVTGSVMQSSLEKNSISVWADQSGNNNNFTGSRARLDTGINNKPTVLIGDITDYAPQIQLRAPSTLFDGLTSCSLIAVCLPIDNNQNASYIYSPYFDISEIYDYDLYRPGSNVSINNSTFLSGIGVNFFQNNGYYINYLDVTTGNGSAYQNGQPSVVTFVNQIVISGAGTTSSNGTYTRNTRGETQFSGPNGNFIYFSGGGEWALYDTQLYNPENDNDGAEAYYTSNFVDWYISGGGYGSSPAPSGLTSTTTATAVTPAGVTLPLPNGTLLELSYNTIYLSELIIYNKRLSTQERQQVEKYLKTKYAIYY
jgi:hypothetical protein